jgi:ABC-type transport system substrate-binding protein
VKKLAVILIAILVCSSLILGCAASAIPTSTSATPTATSTIPTATSATLSTEPVSSSSNPTVGTPKYGGVLKVISNPAIPPFGWPAEQMGGGSEQCCLETLLHGDDKGNAVPWLAESYKVADDLKSITFNLRKGVKFHDGSDFNAEVAKWNLDNFIQASGVPSSGAPPSGGMPPAGAPPSGAPPGGAPPSGGVPPGGAPPSGDMPPAGSSPSGAPPPGGPSSGASNWSSVDIIDNYTIRVNLKKWANTAINDFADNNPTIDMVSKAAFDKNGLEWMRANPVGTGPFKFVSYQQDVGFKAVRNPDYWVKGKPYLDGIEYIFIADSTTQRMTMQIGQADLTSSNPGKESFDCASLGLTVVTAMNSNNVLVPDSANADSPWAKKEVREAVEYAIDREGIAQAFGYGYWQAPYQIPPRTSLAYDPNFALGRKYDPEKAKQLLTEAGYPDGFKTTIIVSPMAKQDVLVAMKADLAKVGIQVDLDFPGLGKWVTILGKNTMHNAAVFMICPMFDSSFVAGLQFTFNNINQFCQITPELTQAYQAAFVSPTPDAKLTRAVTDMMTKDALVIPVYESGMGRATQPYVVSDYYARGSTVFWNTQDAWLNK